MRRKEIESEKRRAKALKIVAGASMCTSQQVAEAMKITSFAAANILSALAKRGEVHKVGAIATQWGGKPVWLWSVDANADPIEYCLGAEAMGAIPGFGAGVPAPVRELERAMNGWVR